MAVDDFLPREIDDLVLPSKCFYPLRIPVIHYQLRHFISSPEPDLIYYASGQDVFCLNVETKRRVHVASLPFDARCTAAAHGWVCVGGAEEGHFASIKLEGNGDSDSSEVDSLLPLDFGARNMARPSYGASKPTAHYEKIGDEIVNSISIHKYPAETDCPEDVVAVLTNNDKTVRVYSLTRSTEISVMQLPFPMNHATISPNGQLLVAVGDYQQAYFFQRTKESKSEANSKAAQAEQEFAASTEWTTLSVVQLHCPPIPGTPPANTTGYFTTVWSHSGSLCAVGSECGYITVFDTELLMESEWGEDAIVSTVPSSRPDVGNGPGAVRTMIFSPHPWDLLIWSEDQGRVCVADMRSRLKARQVLKLDTKEEGLEKVEFADFDVDPEPELQQLSREVDFIRRYRRALDSDGNTASLDLATEYFQAASERRRQSQNPHVVESDNDPHGFTPHERQVLESLRTTSEALRNARDRLVSISSDAERLIVTIPRSINYSSNGTTVNESQSASASNSNAPTATNSTARRSYTAHTTGNLGNTSTSNSSPQPPVVGPSITSLRDFLRERPPPPRSVPLAPTYSARAGEEPSNVSTTINAPRASDNWITRNSETPTTAGEARNGSEPYWPSQGHQAEVAASSASRPDPASDMRRLRQLVRARERVRTLREAQAQAQPLSSYEFEIMRRSGRRLHWDPDCGVRTTGLAMSQDGRKLFVGTEEGIFEYQINLSGRRAFPAVEPR